MVVQQEPLDTWLSHCALLVACRRRSSRPQPHSRGANSALRGEHNLRYRNLSTRPARDAHQFQTKKKFQSENLTNCRHRWTCLHCGGATPLLPSKRRTACSHAICAVHLTTPATGAPYPSLRSVAPCSSTARRHQGKTVRTLCKNWAG
jgi:hypothetical protein